MGLVKPALPELDYGEWRRGTRMERVRPMVQRWAEAGFGTPDAVFLLYVVKIALYVLGGLLFAAATPGIGGLTDVASWWTEPVVFQKVVVWTLLFEVLGLGCGFGPLTMRFLPPVGAFLHWLRPGTIRLPPWPGKVPGTGGTRRTVLDVGLYAAVLGSALWVLLSPATRDAGGLGSSVGLVGTDRMVPLLVLLPLLGLRDKTIFLAARSEVYWTTAVTFVLPGVDMVVAAKLVMLAIWWGAATSKLNHHFPHVVAVMMSNNPLLRVRRLKRRLHRHWPDDIRPSRVSAALAHGGTAVEFLVPLTLFVSRGGTVTVVAATIMVLFHLNILTSIPMGVPLEWNVYMIFGIGFLFVHNAQYGLADLANPLPVAVLLAAIAATVVIGNLAPHRVSFLPAMRYYAGNWDTSLWCLAPSAVDKLDRHVTKSSTLAVAQLTRLYGEQVTDLLLHLGYAFRAMHTHGRALFGLIPRACGPEHETAYLPVEGELVAGTALGWNFGDGHLHNEQLIAALQERCHFDEGEVRVIVLEAQPFHRARQQYRLVDAATGELERGYVAVKDMLVRQAWDADIPVDVVSVVPTAVPGTTPEDVTLEGTSPEGLVQERPAQEGLAGA